MDDRAIKVRACVAMNSKGKYQVTGWDGATDNSLKDCALENMGCADEDTDKLYFIEVEVTIPEVETVKAKIVGQEIPELKP